MNAVILCFLIGSVSSCIKSPDMDLPPVRPTTITDLEDMDTDDPTMPDATTGKEEEMQSTSMGGAIAQTTGIVE